MTSKVSAPLDPLPTVEPTPSPLAPPIDRVGVLVYAPDSLLRPGVPVESLLFLGHGLPHDERGIFGEAASRLAADWQRLAAAGVASVHPSEWARG